MCFPSIWESDSSASCRNQDNSHSFGNQLSVYFVGIWEYIEQVAQLQTARYPLANDARGFPCWKFFCLCCQQLKSYRPLPFGMTHLCHSSLWLVLSEMRPISLFHWESIARNLMNMLFQLRTSHGFLFFPSKKNLCASYSQSYGQMHVYVFFCFTLNSAF